MSKLAAIVFDLDADGKPDLSTWRIEPVDDQNDVEVAGKTPNSESA